MHYEWEGSPAFVFDMMGAGVFGGGRGSAWVLRTEALHPADFTIRDQRVERLNFGVGEEGGLG
jgi:hypothetical protein